MCETATAANRSLYDAVGLANSSLKYRCASPTDGPMRRERTSGVFPSPSVIRACSGTKSSHFSQRQMLIETLVPTSRKQANHWNPQSQYATARHLSCPIIQWARIHGCSFLPGAFERSDHRGCWLANMPGFGGLDSRGDMHSTLGAANSFCSRRRPDQARAMEAIGPVC